MKRHDCSTINSLGAVAAAEVLGIDLETARSQASGFLVKETKLSSTASGLNGKGIDMFNSVLASRSRPKVRRENEKNSGLWFGLTHDKRIV